MQINILTKQGVNKLDLLLQIKRVNICIALIA